MFYISSPFSPHSKLTKLCQSPASLTSCKPEEPGSGPVGHMASACISGRGLHTYTGARHLGAASAPPHLGHECSYSALAIGSWPALKQLPMNWKVHPHHSLRVGRGEEAREKQQWCGHRRKLPGLHTSPHCFSSMGQIQATGSCCIAYTM